MKTNKKKIYEIDTSNKYLVIDVAICRKTRSRVSATDKDYCPVCWDYKETGKKLLEHLNEHTGWKFRCHWESEQFEIKL